MSMLLELKITADGKIAVSEVDKVRAGVDRSTEAGKKQTQATREQRSELERYMASLRKEADTLGMTRAQVRLYEAARLGANTADLRSIEITNQLIAAHERNNTSLNTNTASLVRYAGAMVSVTAALRAVKTLSDLYDTYALLDARIGMVTRGMEQQKRVQRELFDIAQQLKMPYAELAGQFPRIARAIQGYGGSIDDALKVTRIFAQTVKASGATASEAAASAQQFAQALSSGRLGGDELKSILENNGLLAEYLAKGLGVTQGELRKLGEEGKLTSEKIVKALLAQQQALDAQAAQLPKTIAGSWGSLTNEIEKSTTASGSYNASASLLVGTIDLLTARVKKMREEGSFELPFIGAMRQGLNIAQAIANAQGGRGRGSQRGGLDPGMRSHRQGEIAYYNDTTGPEEQARATALRDFRETMKDVETATTINQKYAESIEKITEDWIKLGKTGQQTAEREAQMREAIAMKTLDRQQKIDALAKKGAPSLESEVSLIRTRYDAQLRASEDYYRALNATTEKGLKAEEFYRAAALTTERQYIDQVAALRGQRERTQVAELQRALAIAEDRRGAIAGRKGVGANEAAQHARDLALEEENVRKTREALTLATERLGDAETERGRAQILLDRRIREGTIAIEREREDLSRAMKQELDDLEFEISLLGQSELIQRKLQALRQLELRYLADKERLKRRLQDLERGNASEEELEAARLAVETLEEGYKKSAERLPELVEQQFRGAEGKRIADAISEALIDGGPDAGKRLREMLEAELKKPFKLAMSQGIQQFMSAGQQGNWGQVFNPSQWTQQQGMSVAGAAGNLFGAYGSRAAGAGERGQQTAASLAGTGAMIGFQVGGPWGAAIGAVIGLVAGIFTDPEGNAERKGRVGKNPEGRYTYGGRSPFGGAFGVYDDKWFSDEDMGDDFNRFFSAQSQFETALSRRMSPEERARATASLSGNREYNFGTEQGRTLGLGEILKDRLEAIVEAALPGLGKLVQAFQGTGEELVHFVESLFAMRDSLKDLDTLIAQVSGTGAEVVKLQIDAMNTQVERLKTDLNDAVAAGDATAMYEAEQQLAAAIMNRYQTELNMVRQLQEAVRQIQEQAYQFTLSIAQKINSVGGSRDVGAISLNRAGQLRAGIGGNAPIASKITDINAYVGAIDSWYQARRSQIEAQMAAEQQAMAAIAQAQQAAANARIAQLQRELAAAEKFGELVDRVTASMTDMRLSSANPMSVYGRIGMARDDVSKLREQYRGATGEKRADLANQLLDAINRYRTLGQEGHQRPSLEWEAIYNEIMADYSAIAEDAKSESQKALEIQSRIEQLQGEANRYAAMAATSAQRSNSYLEALNEEALAYYTWAEEEGARLYAIQEQQHQEQLDAITGGMDVELFVAARQAEAVTELRSIRALLAAFLAGTGATPAAGTPLPGPASTGAPGSGNPAARGGTSLTFNIDLPQGGGYSESDIERIAVASVKKAAPTIRRALETS
jgi:tape measure domain-containing protein